MTRIPGTNFDLEDIVRVKDLRDLTDSLPSRDQIAEALGLSSYRSTSSEVSSGIGLFAAGLLVGAALALLFAPKAGQELRQELGERVTSMRDNLGQQGRDAGGGGPRAARTA
jgi:hypothetical protein